jgi:hypothetical protein
VLGAKFNTLPIDDSVASLLSYGGTWTSQAVAGSYGGTVRFATTNKDKAALPNKITFSVTGNIAWISTKGPDRGLASVSVDGGPSVTVDLYAPVAQVAQVVFTTNNLAAGTQHNVTMQVLGLPSANDPSAARASHTRVDIDAVVVVK